LPDQVATAKSPICFYACIFVIKTVFTVKLNKGVLQLQTLVTGQKADWKCFNRKRFLIPCELEAGFALFKI